MVFFMVLVNPMIDLPDLPFGSGIHLRVVDTTGVGKCPFLGILNIT